MRENCQNSKGALLPPKTEGTVRVFCFSDIHLGMFPPWRDLWFSKRCLGAFSQLLMRRHRLKAQNISRLQELIPGIAPDAILCCGDLTSVGEPEEFAWACRELAPVRALMPERFYYVPGNHDVYVADPRGATAMLEALQTLNPKPVLGRVWSLDLPDLSLVFVNAARPVAAWLSCGVIDQTMAEDFERVLQSSPNPVAVCCHFPAVGQNGGKVGGRHGLRGAEVLRKPLEEGRIRAILSGHVHHQYSARVPGGGLQVCSGSLTLHGHCAVVDLPHQGQPEVFLLKI